MSDQANDDCMRDKYDGDAGDVKHPTSNFTNITYNITPVKSYMNYNKLFIIT